MAAGGRHFTRVAVAQIAVHPAAFYNGRDPLEDPLWDPKGTRDTLRLTDAALPALVERMEALRARVRATLCRQVWRKLEAIVAHCREWKVRVLVLPEYSVPWDVLADLAKVVGDMVVVAGTHTVTRASRKSRVYERLGMPTPREGEAVCPVLHRGKLLALQPKLNPARPEQSHMREGTRWDPVVMPDGFPGPMGVLVCLDFLFRESKRFRELVSEGLNKCRFVAVPSLTPFHTLPEFEGKAWEEARRYRRPVLYCDTADGGGTALYVDEERVADLRRFPEQTGYLERGDEGVIVADVDLGYTHTGSSTTYDFERPVVPFAEASLVYACHPAEKRYAEWLREQDARTAESLDDDDDALDAARDAVEAARVTIVDAASLRGRESRKRRLSTFLRDAANVPRMEFLRRYTREVVLPADVLPLGVVRAAVAGAAAKTIDAWSVKWRGVGLDEMVKALGEVGREVAVLAPGEWTDEGRRAVGAVEEAIGDPVEEQAPPPPPPVVRTQVPATFDPATFEDFEADGWTFVFRPDAVTYEREHALHNQLAHPHNPFLDHLDRVQGRSRQPPDWVIPVQQISTLEPLHLLSNAQGLLQSALVVATPRNALVGTAAFVFAACGNCWRIRALAEDAIFDVSSSAIQSILESKGFFPLQIERVSERELDVAVQALRPLVNGASAATDTFLERKLRDFPQSFIDPEVSVDGGPPTSMLGALDAWLTSDVRTALVLGSFGAGKSTTLAQWCHDLWQRDGVRPVFVNLATAGPDRDAIGMLLDAAKADDTPSTRAAMRLLIERSHVLPCFDGFDELSTRTTDHELPERLRRLLAVAEGGGRVLVSSREHYFATETHVTETSRKALVDALGASASWRRICVLELTPDKVRELIDKVHGPERGRAIVRRIETTYDLGDLVKRPLLLAMVLSTIERIDPARKVATADVYEEYLKRWLEQTRAIDGEVFTDAQKQAFAEQLALILWREGASSCPWERLDREVSAHLGSAVPVGMPHGAEWLEMRGGAFFVREDDDRYRFAHRSFLEYFFARALVRELEKRPGEALATRPLTREVIAFVGEILVSRGEVAAAPCVRAVQAWLVGGRARSDDVSVLRETAVAAANALRLLTGLAQHAGSDAQWVLAKSDLRAIELARSELEGVRLAGVSLDYAVLSGSDLRRADLTGAGLRGTRMVACRLDGATLARADLRGADLSRVEAVGVKLTGADLHDARLRGSVWRDCEWDGAQLARADLVAAVGARAARELPTRLAARIEAGHRGCVNAVSWSPQGDRVVSGGRDATVRVWDVASATQIAHFVGHTGWVQSVMWSPQGDRVVSGGRDATVRVWDVTSATQIAHFEGHQDAVYSVAWSPQGDRVVSGSQGGSVCLWDVANAQPIARFWGYSSAVLAVAWSPQGDYVVSGDRDGSVRLWDVANAQQLACCSGHTTGELGSRAVRAVAWSPLGDRVVSGGDDGTVRVWDVASANQLARFKGNRKGVNSVAWSPQGDCVISGGDDGTACVWEVASATQLAHFVGHATGLSGSKAVQSVAWSPQGDRVVSGGQDGSVRVWDVASATQLTHFVGRGGYVRSVAWSPQGDRVVSGGDDGTVRVWDVASANQLAHFVGFRGRVNAVAWSPQGNRVVGGGDDGTVRVWEVASATQLAHFVGHATGLSGSKAVQSVAWSPQGDRVVSGGQDGSVRVWDVASATQLAHFVGFRGGVNAVAWSPQGNRVVSGGSDGSERVWDIDSAAQLAHFVGHRVYVRSIAWSPQGDRVVSGGQDGTLRVWDVASATQLAHFVGHMAGDLFTGGGVQSVAWLPQGDRVVSGGSDGTVRVWDAATFTQIAETENILLPDPTSFAWSPADDRIAVAGRDGTIHIFAMRRPHLLATIHIDGDHTLMSTPGGYVSAGDAGRDRYVLAVHNPKSPGCAIYLPFAPLREFFHRPDKVAAALRGDLSADDPMADLLAAGYSLDHAWDGNAVYFPDDASPPTAATSPAPTPENPFLPGRAIETADDLFGRARVFADLCAFVQSRQPVVLEGPRRSGKTSILTVFEAHLRREGREAVVVSLEGEELATKHDLARLLCPDLADHKDPATQFVRTFSKRRDVVFLIDEVVHLTKLAPRDLAWVRKVCQKTASFVFAGSPWDWQRVLTHGAREPGSSLGNDVRRLSLGEMPKRDAIEALTRKAPPDAPIPEATAAWIVEACGVWPYYLQILGWELVQRSRAGDRSAHNERDAMKRLIESELPRQAEAAFRSRWNELPERARRVLVTERDPRNIARHDLDLLVLTGLLRDESGWLHDPPFFDWILRYKTSLPLTPEPAP